MHFTATFVPSLDVARMTRLKAPVPSSLSSRLYFRANSEFASARSPPPPALEPCVGCRVSAFSLPLSCMRSLSLLTCTRSRHRADAITGTTSRRWRGTFTPSGRLRPGSRRARSLSIGVRARARSLHPCGPRAAARAAPSARRPRGARNSSKQLRLLCGHCCARRHGGGTDAESVRHSP